MPLCALSSNLCVCMQHVLVGVRVHHRHAPALPPAHPHLRSLAQTLHAQPPIYKTCVQANERVVLPLKIQSLQPPHGYGPSPPSLATAPEGNASVAAAAAPNGSRYSLYIRACDPVCEGAGVGEGSKCAPGLLPCCCAALLVRTQRPLPSRSGQGQGWAAAQQPHQCGL